MSEPFKDVQTTVQDVWEILTDDGTVWTHVEAPTAAEAVATARERLREGVEMQDRLEARWGREVDEFDWHSTKLATVRRRVSVSVIVYTTEYSDEQAIEEVEAHA